MSDYLEDSLGRLASWSGLGIYYIYLDFLTKSIVG